MNDKYYLILAGGVGAAKFIKGLANVIDPALLKIVINTGDDIELFGLKMCPDIDIITYTLANIVDKEKGWGFQDETFNCITVLNGLMPEIKIWQLIFIVPIYLKKGLIRQK